MLGDNYKIAALAIWKEVYDVDVLHAYKTGKPVKPSNTLSLERTKTKFCKYFIRLEVIHHSVELVWIYAHFMHNQVTRKVALSSVGFTCLWQRL